MNWRGKFLVMIMMEKWYPKEEYERDMRNLVIAIYKSTIEYVRILEGETQQKVGLHYASTTGPELSLFHPLRR